MRALGVDYGRKRVGLALSDATGLLARPWKAIGSGITVSAMAAELACEIETLRQDSDGLEVVVLGLPRRLSGEDNDQTPLVQDLAARLRQLTTIPVVLQDERLSSHEAESLLARREKNWRKRKAMLDAAAAAVILQDYLDAQSNRGEWASSPGHPAQPIERLEEEP